MSNVIVTAVVKFYAVAPDGVAEGDVWADELSADIAEAVNQIGRGVIKDSASVIDWTEQGDA